MRNNADLRGGRQGALQEWRENWPLVVAASLSAGVVNTHFYAFGVFVKPLSAATGWSRGDIGLVQLIYSIVTILLGPLVGMLADRVGPRKLAISGMIAYCLCIASYSQVRDDINLFYALGFLNASASLFCNATILTMVISHRFRSALGLALSITLAGSAIYASTIVPVFATVMIDTFDFRIAYLALGLVGMILTVPLLVLYFDKGNITSVTERPMPAAHWRHNLFQVVGGRYFWRIGVSAFLVQMGTTGLVAHFIPILTDIGMTAASAAGVAAAIGVTSLICRLGAGALLDRFRAPLIGAACFVAPLFACLLLLLGAGDQRLVVVAAGLVGLAVGAEIDIISYLLVKFVGRSSYGLKFAIIYGLCSFGTGVGVWVAGLIFDRYGSYDNALMLFMGTSGCAAILIASLGAYPRIETGFDRRA